MRPERGSGGERFAPTGRTRRRWWRSSPRSALSGRPRSRSTAVGLLCWWPGREGTCLPLSLTSHALASSSAYGLDHVVESSSCRYHSFKFRDISESSFIRMEIHFDILISESFIKFRQAVCKLCTIPFRESAHSPTSTLLLLNAVAFSAMQYAMQYAIIFSNMANCTSNSTSDSVAATQRAAMALTKGPIMTPQRPAWLRQPS